MSFYTALLGSLGGGVISTSQPPVQTDTLFFLRKPEENKVYNDPTDNILINSAITPEDDLYTGNILQWGTAQVKGNFNSVTPEMDFTTVKLWETTQEGDRAFNHFSRLHEYNGKIYCAWMTHSKDEHGPGQNIRYTHSSDYGVTWSPVVDLFDPMDDISVSLGTREGRLIMPVGFVELSDGLYYVGEVNDDRNLAEDWIGAIVRKVDGDTLDTPFWGWVYNNAQSAPAPISGYPAYNYEPEKWAEIKAYFTSTGNRPPNHGALSIELESRLHHNHVQYDPRGGFIEQTDAPLPNGKSVRIWRGFWSTVSQGVHYAQYSETGNLYSNVPKTTNLPSARSLCTLQNIDGVLMLMGNPVNFAETRDSLLFTMTPESPIAGETELVFQPENIYTLREVGTGSNARYNGVAKSGHFGYPHFIKMSNGKIGCSYSTVGKEDMEFSSFNIPALI